METRGFKILIKVFAALLLVFLYVPLAIIVLYAFNDSVAQAWPIQEFTTKWFGIAWIGRASCRERVCSVV